MLCTPAFICKVEKLNNLKSYPALWYAERTHHPMQYKSPPQEDWSVSHLY